MRQVPAAKTVKKPKKERKSPTRVTEAEVMGALNMVLEDVTSDLDESRGRPPKKKKKKKKHGAAMGVEGEAEKAKKKKKKKSSKKSSDGAETNKKKKKRRPSLDDGINLASAYGPSESEYSESESSANLQLAKLRATQEMGSSAHSGNHNADVGRARIQTGRVTDTV